MKYEFAIKRHVLKDETEILCPVVRVKRRFFKETWQRIVKIYDKYLIQELDWEPVLSLEDCKDHIDGYRLHLEKQGAKVTKAIIYDDIQEKVL